MSENRAAVLFLFLNISWVLQEWGMVTKNKKNPGVEPGFYIGEGG